MRTMANSPRTGDSGTDYENFTIMNEGHTYHKYSYRNHAAGNSGIVTGGDGPQVLGGVDRCAIRRDARRWWLWRV